MFRKSLLGLAGVGAAAPLGFRSVNIIAGVGAAAPLGFRFSLKKNAMHRGSLASIT